MPVSKRLFAVGATRRRSVWREIAPVLSRATVRVTTNGIRANVLLSLSKDVRRSRIARNACRVLSVVGVKTMASVIRKPNSPKTVHTSERGTVEVTYFYFIFLYFILFLFFKNII